MRAPTFSVISAERFEGPTIGHSSDQTRQQSDVDGSPNADPDNAYLGDYIGGLIVNPTSGMPHSQFARLPI
jgi:hypothetical protein